MSISRIQAVWTHSKSVGNDRLLLIALADAANDEGLSWPGINTLITKVNAARATVLACIARLEEMGELYVEHRRKRGNRYLIIPGLSDGAVRSGLVQFFGLDAASAQQALVELRRKAGLPLKTKRGNKSNLQTSNKSEHQTYDKSNHQTYSAEISLIDPPNKSNHQTGSFKNPRSILLLDSDHSRARAKEKAEGGGGEKQTDQVDPQFIELVRDYENNFGPITPMIGEMLSDDYGAYPYEWLSAAMRMAVRRNARNWAYVNSILQRWQREGFDGGTDTPQRNGGKAPLHIPRPVPGCPTCGGETGALVTLDGKTVPCPACLAAERKEGRHERTS